MRRLVYTSVVICLLLSLVFVASVSAAPAQADRGAWAPGMALVVNDTVTYAGCTYRVLQSHTSLAGWEPPTTPALFTQVSCGGGATATRTNTPGTGPTATRTATTVPGTGVIFYQDSNYGGTASGAKAVGDYATMPSDVPNDWMSSLRVPAGWVVDAYADGNFGGAVCTYTADTSWVGAACNDVMSSFRIRLGSGSTPTRTNTPTGPTPPPTNTPIPCTSNCGGTRVLGYFAQWTVYARQYFVKNIVTSGSASKLTHINYAFGNVTNGQCVIGDAYADYDMAYTTANSIDGVADTWDAGALRGNFNQLRKLKAQYPNIKILWSFGGWTWSGGFGQAAANPTAFANSCYNLVEDPRWADVFDGIDIDWEYPNACGLTCDASGTASFRNLMSALRTRFGSSYLVTAAVPAGYDKINPADYGGAAQYVDWYNVMTYDFFGGWASTGPTAPHSPLTSWSNIPIANYYTDYAIQLYKSKGVPANKLLIGIGFYGRGWTGVSQSAVGGSASGPAAGTYDAGVNDYKVLVSSCPSNGTVAGTAYAYCGNNWWSYDTPATIASKMTYKKNQGLGGAFFWELSGDTSGGALITALYNNR